MGADSSLEREHPARRVARRDARWLATSYFHGALLLLVVGLVGCTDSPTALELRADLNAIEALGFRTDMVVDRGDYYLVEGDIQLNKSYLRQLRSATERPHGQQIPGPSFQYYTNELVTNAGAIQTIKVDLSGVASNSGWHDAAVVALTDWSTVPNSYVKMVEGTPADITFYLINDDAGLAARTNGFPGGGAPADTVYLNNNFVATDAVYRRNVVHELGHTIGFRHSNWNQVDAAGCTSPNGDAGTVGANHVPYTPTSGGDPASVMNGCTAGEAWNGFGDNDKLAIRYLYPIPGTAVTVTFPDGSTPTISWEPVVGATSYRVGLYNADYWNTPSGPVDNYGYTDIMGTTTGTTFTDPSRTYTGYSQCYWYYPDVPEDDRRYYYYSVDALLPNGSSLSLGVAPVANEPTADSCSP